MPSYRASSSYFFLVFGLLSIVSYYYKKFQFFSIFLGFCLLYGNSLKHVTKNCELHLTKWGMHYNLVVTCDLVGVL